MAAETTKALSRGKRTVGVPRHRESLIDVVTKESTKMWLAVTHRALLVHLKFPSLYIAFESMSATIQKIQIIWSNSFIVPMGCRDSLRCLPQLAELTLAGLVMDTGLAEAFFAKAAQPETFEAVSCDAR